MSPPVVSATHPCQGSVKTGRSRPSAPEGRCSLLHESPPSVVRSSTYSQPPSPSVRQAYTVASPLVRLRKVRLLGLPLTFVVDCSQWAPPSAVR